MFQATREAAAADSDLHQGRLGAVNKERSSDGDCAEDKVDRYGRAKCEDRGRRTTNQGKRHKGRLGENGRRLKEDRNWGKRAG